MRGSSFLLQKSIRFYEPLIRYIASTQLGLWQIDVDCYSDENIQLLYDSGKQIGEVLRKDIGVSEILLTKIMLGVFGNVPAFDTYFKQGLGIRWNSRKSLKQVSEFYQVHKENIDAYKIYTFDFHTGEPTMRQYPKAKIIDMIGFVEGQG